MLKFTSWSIEDFVTESNRIEGILREPTTAEIEAHKWFINLIRPAVGDLESLVSVVAPGTRLRDLPGINVRVGDHIAPAGGPEIRVALETILNKAFTPDDPWQVHIEYETLHPFTDGNGRSGRALWLWQMQTAPIGFLHQFYYQTLARVGRVN